MTTPTTPDPVDEPTPESSEARTRALGKIQEKIEVRPFDLNKERDGNHNFVHRIDVITAVDIVNKKSKTLERRAIRAEKTLRELAAHTLAIDEHNAVLQSQLRSAHGVIRNLLDARPGRDEYNIARDDARIWLSTQPDKETK